MAKISIKKILLIVIGVIVVILIIAGIAGGGSKDADSTVSSQETTTKTNTQTANTNSFIKPGMYKVGSEVKAGEYVIEATNNNGYFQVSSDSSGEFDSIIVNDNLNKGEFRYIIIKDDDYIKLQNCRMYLSADKIIQPKNLDKIPPSTYKIGKDIPPGEYKLKAITQYAAYWERSNNPRDSISGIIANDNIDDSAYVTVLNGEYFKIVGIEAALVK